MIRVQDAQWVGCEEQEQEYKSQGEEDAFYTTGDKAS